MQNNFLISMKHQTGCAVKQKLRIGKPALTHGTIINSQEVIKMAHVKNHVQNLLPIKSTSSADSKTALSDKWIAALFRKFAARYMHKWTTAIEGNEVFTMREWADCLAGVTGEQIKNGLQHCDDSWPPSAMQFLKYCLTEYKEQKIEYYKALPESDSAKQHRKAVAAEKMKIIKELVK